MAYSVPYISSSTVRKVLQMSELIPLVEKAMVNYSRSGGSGGGGGVVQPLRETLPIRERDAFLFTMPVYSRADGVLATKLVTLFPHNRNLPSHHGVIVLMSAENGSVLSFLDAEVITEMRTAAASAVATKYLSDASSTSLKLTILGSGVQARGHLRALRLVRSFAEVRVWSPNERSRQAFVDEFREENESGGGCSSSFNILACDSVEEAVVDADVIVTATLAKEPILFKHFVKEGAHVNAVGAPRPDQREIDGDLVRSSHVVVDSMVGALKEAGDVILNRAEDRIVAELGTVATMEEEERTRAFGAAQKQTTIFKNLGMAIQDAVAAKYVYDKVLAGGDL